MKIQIEVRGAEIRDHYVFDQSCIKIGRRRANDIRITDSRISGSHAEIRAHKDLAGRYDFVDLHSRNGSMLARGESNVVLQGGVPVLLEWGDQIFLGDRHQPIVVSVQAEPVASTDIAIEPMSDISLSQSMTSENNQTFTDLDIEHFDIDLEMLEDIAQQEDEEDQQVVAQAVENDSHHKAIDSNVESDSLNHETHVAQEKSSSVSHENIEASIKDKTNKIHYEEHESLDLDSGSVDDDLMNRYLMTQAPHSALKKSLARQDSSVDPITSAHQASPVSSARDLPISSYSSPPSSSAPSSSAPSSSAPSSSAPSSSPPSPSSVNNPVLEMSLEPSNSSEDQIVLASVSATSVDVPAMNTTPTHSTTQNTKHKTTDPSAGLDLQRELEEITHLLDHDLHILDFSKDQPYTPSEQVNTIKHQQNKAETKLSSTTTYKPENTVPSSSQNISSTTNASKPIQVKSFECEQLHHHHDPQVFQLICQFNQFDEKQALLNHILRTIQKRNPSVKHLGYYDYLQSPQIQIQVFTWLSQAYQHPITIESNWQILLKQKQLVWVKTTQFSYYLCPLMNDGNQLMGVLVIQAEEEDEKKRSSYMQITQALSAALLRIKRQMKADKNEVVDPWPIHDVGQQSFTPRLVGQAANFVNCLQFVREVSSQDANVLLIGPSGCGKSSMAHVLHAHSRRNTHPFIHLHCGQLNASSLKNMLFGQHANPKSFSQLTPDSALIRAQDTSLYLDQVEAMSPHLQNLLYHFIKTYQTQSHSRFPRLIFSTHVDLSQQVDQVKFSRNLYESCIRFTIQVPPLQKRLQDIRALSYYFMRLSMNRYGVWINHIQSTAIQLLEQYHWPHNIRQLEQVIEKAVLVAQSKHYIEAQHIQSILDEQPKHL